jgi:hypothetical protein
MNFVLTEYRKAIESEGLVAHMPTTEEDLKTFEALREKIRREIEHDVSKELRKQLDRQIRA